jgi:hypothetical protein
MLDNEKESAIDYLNYVVGFVEVTLLLALLVLEAIYCWCPPGHASGVLITCKRVFKSILKQTTMRINPTNRYTEMVVAFHCFQDILRQS